MGLFRIRRAVVVGCGDFGSAVAEKLSSVGYSVTAIDKDASAFNGFASRFGGEMVLGDGFDVTVLEEHGVREACLLAACTGEDSINYFVGRIAREVYGTERVFARIEDEDLIGLLDESTVEPICPHAICLAEFCRAARIS